MSKHIYDWLWNYWWASCVATQQHGWSPWDVVCNPDLGTGNTQTLVGQTNLQNKKNANIANILLAYHRLCTYCMRRKKETDMYSLHCVNYIVFIILYSFHCIHNIVFIILYSLYCIHHIVFIHCIRYLYCIHYIVFLYIIFITL